MQYRILIVALCTALALAAPTQHANRGVLGDIGDAISDTAGDVVDGAKDVGGAIATGVEDVGGAVATGVQDASNAVETGAKAVGNAVKAGAKDVGDAVATGAKAVGSAASTVASDIANCDVVKCAAALGPAAVSCGTAVANFVKDNPEITEAAEDVGEVAEAAKRNAMKRGTGASAAGCLAGILNNAKNPPTACGKCF